MEDPLYRVDNDWKYGNMVFEQLESTAKGRERSEKSMCLLIVFSDYLNQGFEICFHF